MHWSTLITAVRPSLNLSTHFQGFVTVAHAAQVSPLTFPAAPVSRRSSPHLVHPEAVVRCYREQPIWGPQEHDTRL